MQNPALSMGFFQTSKKLCGLRRCFLMARPVARQTFFSCLTCLFDQRKHMLDLLQLLFLASLQSVPVLRQQCPIPPHRCSKFGLER